MIDNDMGKDILRRKVLIVVSSLNTGGAQRVSANLSKGLPETCQVDFLLNESEDISYSYRGNIYDLGLAKETNRRKLSYQILVFVRRLRALYRLKRRNQYDAVFSFIDSANIANILTGNKYCRTIISVHAMLSNHYSVNEYRFIVIPLIKLLYRYADVIVAVSGAVKDDLKNKIGVKNNNIVLINNGFDIKEILELGNKDLAPEDEQLFKDHVVITAMGRLAKIKGFSYLIRAMKRICEQRPDSRLIILGEGNERESLQNLIDKLDLGDKVILLGQRNNPFGIIKHSNIFVLSSLDEAFPSALIEAISLGIPCVSTALPGIREILAPDMTDVTEVTDELCIAKYGIITPMIRNSEHSLELGLIKEEELMADAVIRLMDDDVLRQHYMESSDDIRNRFNLENMASQWLEII